MRRFKWIEWNVGKVNGHALSVGEVEAAFDRVYLSRQRKDGSFETYAEIPSGRHIWVIWRYDSEPDEAPDVFLDVDEPTTFVITAY